MGGCGDPSQNWQSTRHSSGQHRSVPSLRSSPSGSTQHSGYADEGKGDIDMQFKYPFQVDNRGHTAITDEEQHIRQLIEQVLFTALGERVNRPTFGSSINQLVFAPNSEELAAATQMLVQGSLQQWLGNLILVKSVDVQSVDSTLTVTVQYIVRRNQQPQEAKFTRAI